MLALSTRGSQEMKPRHAPEGSQKSLWAPVESNKATSLLRLRKRVLSEDLLNRQTCRGHSVCVPAQYPYIFTLTLGGIT